MIQNVNWYDFSDRFTQSDTYKNNFSYDALKALFEYFENYEEDIGEQIEFDMIAICCDWTEYDNLKEVKNNYNISSFKELENNTTVIKLDNGHLLIKNY